jgi:hypothetical protein
MPAQVKKEKLPVALTLEWWRNQRVESEADRVYNNRLFAKTEQEKWQTLAFSHQKKNEVLNGSRIKVLPLRTGHRGNRKDTWRPEGGLHAPSPDI